MDSKYLIICLFLLTACSQKEADLRQGPPETIGILQQRFESTPPVSSSQLEGWLQAQIPTGTSAQELSATCFTIHGIPRTEGEVVWSDESGYVALLVTDYSADSLSYLQLYQRFLTESPAEADPELSWAGDMQGFAWNWQEPGTPIHYLEAGLFDRFHIRLRSNFPHGNAFLKELAKEKNWNQIFSNP